MFDGLLSKAHGVESVGWFAKVGGTLLFTVIVDNPEQYEKANCPNHETELGKVIDFKDEHP